MAMHMCLLRISDPLLGKVGVVAMVIHNSLLRGSTTQLEKRKDYRGHRFPPSSGKGRGGGHGHTPFSS